MADAAQLDREIAESYLGKRLTARNLPFLRKRRVTGIARRVDASLHGDVMLWLELTDGSLVPVFLEDVVPEVPPATAHYWKSRPR
jgi:hypothetical protein